MPSSSSKKRVREDTDTEEGPSSRPRKVHPFFRKPSGAAAVDDTPKPFKWLPSLGPTASCLHAINQNPISSTKVAALDLDGTVIKADLRNHTEWQWWAPAVPKKLRELHDDGYSIVLISNQNLKSANLTTWREKVAKIANALDTIPFRMFAATAKDGFRKPMPGMWYELEKIFAKDDIQIDKSESFFVGDAAGRIYSKSKKDFASTDRKWALNLDLKFLTPEEYFLGLAPHTNFELPGFNVSSLSVLPHILPSSSPLLPPATTQELILFVGFPCLGKTTFYRRHFQSAGYIHINQDTLKTRAKCVRAALDTLKAGNSCVIDNTNRDSTTRQLYLDIAKKHKIPVRCFHFSGSMDLAWHNNMYRAFVHPTAQTHERRELLPFTAFISFRDAYEEPGLEEGFTEIRRINWVLEGTEEERKSWSMWLQLSGK